MSKLAREVDEYIAKYGPDVINPATPGHEVEHALKRELFVELARVTGFRERWVRAFNPDHTDDPTMYRALREANIPLHDPRGWYMFLDDERELSYLGLTPEDNVTVCRSSKEAMRLCIVRGPPSMMYLDHDLGLLHPETGLISRGLDTTMMFLRWATNKFDDWDFDYEVHSMNPEGAKNIKSLLDSYTRSR